MLNNLLAYQTEFLTIAGIHLLAVASPGPDFALVLRHSVSYGRKAAILTSLGIGSGILVHVSYSLLGIGLLIKATPWIFHLLSYAAAAYLCWIGVHALRSSAQVYAGKTRQAAEQGISNKQAFTRGFLTNGLNPKATLFFLALFAVVISPATPTSVRIMYGGYLAVATALWFCFLSYWLSSPAVRAFIGKQGHWFDRVMGIMLIGLALRLVIAN